MVTRRYRGLQDPNGTPTPTLSAHKDPFFCAEPVALLAGQLAPRSLVEYTRDFAAYLDFCTSLEQALVAGSLARWRTALAQTTHLSPHTINRRLSGIKRVMREAALQGYLDHETSEAFQRVPGVQVSALRERLKASTRTRLTPGEMRRLCDAPDLSRLIGWRDRALLHTLATSGCRVSEVVGLTEHHLVVREGACFLEVLGKGQSAPREALLSWEAYAAMQSWLARRPVESPYVFTSWGGKGTRPTGRPMHISAAWRVVQKYAAHVGLAGITPHTFRRFLGTALAKGDIRMAQRALGHHSIETTARHYVLDALPGGLSDQLY